MIGHILHIGTSEPVSPTTTRLITGNDLMTQFDLKPGPEIGAVLERVEEARSAGEIDTKEQALEMAADLLKMAKTPVETYLAEPLAPEVRRNGSN